MQTATAQRPQFTEALIRAKLVTDQRWLEQAVVAIYKRQTPDEQASQTTAHLNGRGFSGVDARTGSYLARWLMRGPSFHLSGKFLDRARRMMPKYSKQLLECALARQAREQHQEAA